MREKTSSRHHGTVAFPLFAALLIAAGTLLLLYNFDMLPQGIWHALARFWPVILVIIGVNIFLRPHPWAAGFIILLIMLTTIGIAVWLADTYPRDYALWGYSIPLSSLV